MISIDSSSEQQGDGWMMYTTLGDTVKDQR